MESLDQVRKAVAAKLALVPEVRRDSMPLYGGSRQDGSPHLEPVGDEVHYVVCERGFEDSRERFRDLGALLYRIFRAATFSAAVQYEVRHRAEAPAQDCRRVIFGKQRELMARLDPAWGEAISAHHAEVLTAHPFVDRP
jgi:hypothetical protein